MRMSIYGLATREWRARFPGYAEKAILGLAVAAAVLGYGATLRAAPLPPIEQVTIGMNQELLVNGKPFFPMIMTLAGHWHEGHAEVAAAGFNAIDIYGTANYGREDLNNAWTNNLYGVVTLNDRWKDMTELAALVEELRDHPALLAWALPDEPDIYTTHTPELIRQMYDVIKAADPRHPVCLNLSEPGRGGEYARACDIISEDSYPVQKMHYHLSLPALRARQLRHNVQEAPYFEDRKPVWAYVQTYRVDNHDLDSIGPAPTPAQVRCMAYMLIANRVTGLPFYSFHETGSKVGRSGADLPSSQAGWRLSRDEPELWASLKILNEEIRGLTPVILAGTAPAQIEVQMLAPASAKTDPWGFAPLHTLVRQWDGALYVIAVNGLDEPVAARFQLSGLGGFRPASQAAVLFEDRAVEVIRSTADASFTDEFASNGVHVYRLPRHRIRWGFAGASEKHNPRN